MRWFSRLVGRLSACCVTLVVSLCLTGCYENTKPLPGGYSLTTRHSDGWIILAPHQFKGSGEVVVGRYPLSGIDQRAFVEAVAVSGVFIAARAPDLDTPGNPPMFFLIHSSTRRVHKYSKVDDFRRSWLDAGGRGLDDLVRPEAFRWTP